MTKIVAYIIAQIIKLKLKLKEGKMTDSKKWYLSKTIWCSILTVLFGLYDLVGANIAPIFNFTLPLIPSWIYTILGVLVGYSRVVATKSIQ